MSLQDVIRKLTDTHKLLHYMHTYGKEQNSDVISSNLGALRKDINQMILVLLQVTRYLANKHKKVAIQIVVKILWVWLLMIGLPTKNIGDFEIADYNIFCRMIIKIIFILI